MRCIIVTLVVVTVAATGEAQPGLDKDAIWQVGLAQAKITPEQPVLLAGYANRTKPFEKVAADLYVKVLALEDAGGHKAVIVTSDLLGFPAAVAEPICQRISERTGLKRDDILLNSSHTHSAPMLSLTPPKEAPGGEGLRTIDYTRQLQDRVVETVVQALARREPARLSWGSGVVDFVMNRREFRAGNVILGVNPRGLADRTVPVVRIDDVDGKLRAVLFGAAVHGTTLTGDNYQVCGDYAGFAQTAIQKRLPQVQTLFMLGCAGDANPYPRGTMDLAKKHGQTLADEVCRVLDTKLRPVRGPLRVAFDRALLPLQPVPPRAELQRLAADKRSPRTWGAAGLLALVNRGEKPASHYACPLAVWQLGKDLTLVGLSGEVVVDYVPLLEKRLGPENLWIAGYCNDVFGYLPSARVLSEGGYETRGLYAGGWGFFDPRAEETVVSAVSVLAKKVGR
jgi:hypothetical protein